MVKKSVKKFDFKTSSAKGGGNTPIPDWDWVFNKLIEASKIPKEYLSRF